MCHVIHMNSSCHTSYLIQSFWPVFCNVGQYIYPCVHAYVYICLCKQVEDPNSSGGMNKVAVVSSLKYLYTRSCIQI